MVICHEIFRYVMVIYVMVSGHICHGEKKFCDVLQPFFIVVIIIKLMINLIHLLLLNSFSQHIRARMLPNSYVTQCIYLLPNA